MPYYIFKMTTDKKLTFVEENPNYREARTLSRSLRGELAKDDTVQIKMTFAKSRSEAEKLLTMEREPRPLGEELG